MPASLLASLLASLFGRLSAALILAIGLCVGPALSQTLPSEAVPIFNRHASAGTLAVGVPELQRFAAANRSDATAQLALGFAQFGRAVEKLGQGFHRHGLSAPRQMLIPFLRLPVPENPNPEPLDYAKLQAIYDMFLADLAQAEATLASLPPGDAKLVTDLHAVRLDVNRNGTGDDDERLEVILRNVMRLPPANTGWEVAFDRADATWLRGYTQVLSGTLEFAMAHDWSESYRQTGHLFFKGALDRANPLHAEAASNPMIGRDAAPVADFIAFLHLVRWNVAEPERLKKAHGHFKRVVSLSRQNWREILAETDDDREWLPGPQQKSAAVSGLSVTQDQVDAWLKVMDTFDAALDGRLLVAHWRFQKGFDLKAVFFEPRPFDLMLWITGHAALPYLKDGPVLDGRSSNQLVSVFSGNFMAYAFWFN
jgi:hypothetical protein